MHNLKVISNPNVDLAIKKYPAVVQKKLIELRNLIIETATAMDSVTELEETLKWGEPSYLTKHGSTVRIDWKPKNPDMVAIYFKCTSKLVPTFKTFYGKILEFETNRAIVLPIDSKFPIEPIKHCITAALRYHKVKHLPDLGIEQS